MRTAIVTGASRGIGKAIANALARPGYNVAVISRHYDEARSTAEEMQNSLTRYVGSVTPFECDVRNAGDVRKTFDELYRRFASIDVLVNNAGVNSRRTLDFKGDWAGRLDDNLYGWHDELATNLDGTYICSYLAAGYMTRRRSGSIVNIASVKGQEATSSPGYGVSKAGIIHLTKDFAKVLGPQGIRVNCVAPGFIDTGMTTELPDEKKEMYKNMIPVKRFGTVEDVAKLVAWLVSDEAGYVNGQTLNIDGGYLMR